MLQPPREIASLFKIQHMFYRLEYYPILTCRNDATTCYGLMCVCVCMCVCVYVCMCVCVYVCMCLCVYGSVSWWRQEICDAYGVLDKLTPQHTYVHTYIHTQDIYTSSHLYRPTITHPVNVSVYRVYVYVSMYMCLCVCVCVYVSMYMCLCISVYGYVSMYMSSIITITLTISACPLSLYNIRTYTHTRTYIHTYIHTYMQ